ETVLGGTARQLLVPEDRFEEFSRAVDLLHFDRRLTFHAAPTGLTYEGVPAEDRIAGKLVHDESSPFTGWVRRHVADPSRNALCVDEASELAGEGLRVSLSGQTRSGRRGAHGRSSAEYVIGFSNEDALLEIDAELARVSEELDRCEQDLKAADARLAELDYLKSAYDAVRTYRWADIDVEGARERVTDLAERRDAILNSDDTLRALEEQILTLGEHVEEANADRVRLKDRRDSLEGRFADLVTDEDDTNDEIEQILERGEVELTDEQAGELDAEFVEAVGPGDAGSLDDFTTNLGRLQARLRETSESSAEVVAYVDAELARIFESYKSQWPDPNLSTAPEALKDFLAILEEISSTGLGAQRNVWKERLAEWSGQDLVPLAGAMSAAVEEIEDRLDPINEILRLLPFGPTGDRLRMRLRNLAPTHVTDFLRQLRTLSADTTLAMEEEALEQRFQQLRVFINQIRRRDDPLARPGSGDRDRLLDVRRHVEVYAERLRPDGTHVSNYRTLAQKSGGETQELVAFIIGAALRFRLGDEERQRPRFAPVFLDEAFIKADAQFAGRAVHAWKGLGFQIVVGAPEDKVNALEPHMDKMFAVLKNHETNLSRVVEMQDVQGD
ncbi:MAG: SbcC/MukB-like Walker B domain-containing protein, partial [Nocardioides sp.]|uniref:SbcC/MukB-like Walker B domain-containing protein n=1 Tax=Nocardioides sp. TaxID=35761 RepID=UPI003F124E6E